MESFSMKAEGGTSLSPSGFQEVDPNTAVGKTPAKIGTHEPFLNVPVHSTFARSSDASSDLSLYSADNDNERSAERLLPALRGYRLDSRSPTPNVSWKAKGLQLWAKNKGLVLVILSQLFGVMMNVTTRLLEMDGKHGPGMHPFQILVARMSGTLILSGIYQWLAKVEHAPFGPREVWKLLVARGVGGFFGVYGMYYSLEYLPLSDATVITFLAPIVACWASSIFLHEPFTRAEQIAALISFLGVILIARPTSLIPGGFDPSISGDGAADVLPSTNATLSGDPQGLHNVTSAQRLGAIGVALTGVLGAACAYSTIRWIGKRAHPLISVNYFAFWAAFVSTIGLLVLPGVGFQLPASPRQWVYLIFLGLCGFVMQFLLTAGLAAENSSRATNMVYTQMVFALAFDKLVWNATPGMWSIVGSSLILGSALYVAVLSNNTKKGRVIRNDRADEEAALTIGTSDDEDDRESNGRGRLREVQEVQLRTLRV